MKDPYKTLGVEKDADNKVIKKAYHKLALKLHPDKNQGDSKAEEKFKEVNSAYDILSDPEKRKQYDTFGDVGPRVQQQSHNPFQDIMNDIMGGRGGFWGNRREGIRGQSIRKTIQLDFMSAINGATKKISINYPEECNSCGGNGSKDGSHTEQCKTCNGSGRIGRNHGMMQIMQTCPSCNGRGYEIKEKCTKCGGSGQKIKNEVLKVKIPKGIDHGMTIRLAGKGYKSPYGAENGDLLLTVAVGKHPEFNRSGINIYSKKQIDYTDAIIGMKLSVNTVCGKAKVSVPAGTQPGAILRIPGKGVEISEKKGDHFVEIKVKIPSKTTDQELELIKKIKNIKK